MATKATSNEEIIAALLQHGTIKEAAEAIGITPRTIYDRMKSRDFMADYAAAKSDILRSAVVNVSGKLSQAFEEINGINFAREERPKVDAKMRDLIKEKEEYLEKFGQKDTAQ